MFWPQAQDPHRHSTPALFRSLFSINISIVHQNKTRDPVHNPKVFKCTSITFPSKKQSKSPYSKKKKKNKNKKPLFSSNQAKIWVDLISNEERPKKFSRTSVFLNTAQYFFKNNVQTKTQFDFFYPSKQANLA